MEKQTLNPAIAGSYQNAPVLYNGVVREVYGVNINCVALFTETDEFECVEHEESQLILTPLSKISDEDAVEVAKMLNYREDVDMSELLEHMKDVINIRKVGDVFGNIDSKNIADNDVSPMVILRIYDFLRSRSYDCGYGSIQSLIQAGIAVDGTLLTDKK